MIDDFFKKIIINKGITNKLFLKRNFGYGGNKTNVHYVDLGEYIIYLYGYDLFADKIPSVYDYYAMRKISQKMHDDFEIDELKNKYIIIYQYSTKVQVSERIYEYLGLFKYIDKLLNKVDYFNIYENSKSHEYNLIPFYYPSYEEGKGYIPYLQYDFKRNNDLNDLSSIREDDYNTSNYIIDNMKLLLMEKLKNNTNLKEKFTSLINALDGLEVLLYETSFEYENIDNKKIILKDSRKLTDDFIRIMTDGE